MPPCSPATRCCFAPPPICSPISMAILPACVAASSAPMPAPRCWSLTSVDTWLRRPRRRPALRSDQPPLRTQFYSADDQQGFQRLEHGFPQCYLHRGAAGSPHSSCRRHPHRGHFLPRPGKRTGSRRAQEKLRKEPPCPLILKPIAKPCSISISACPIPRAV